MLAVGGESEVHSFLLAGDFAHHETKMQCPSILPVKGLQKYNPTDHNVFYTAVLIAIV